MTRECILCREEFGEEFVELEDTGLCVGCADDWGREIAGLPPVVGAEAREKRREQLRNEATKPVGRPFGVEE